MHTLKPLDVEGVAELLDRFETVLVLEEPAIYYGLGTRVKAIAWDSRARCRLHTFGLKDEFIHFVGTTAQLWGRTR